jgi:hypothetical protein
MFALLTFAIFLKCFAPDSAQHELTREAQVEDVTIGWTGYMSIPGWM